MDAHKGDGSAKPPKARSDSIDDFGVFDDAKTYYQPERHKGTKASARTRTFSQVRTVQCLAIEHYIQDQYLRDMRYRIVY